MGKQIDVLKGLLKKAELKALMHQLKGKREKKFARERIELLIDRDSPFRVISPSWIKS